MKFRDIARWTIAVKASKKKKIKIYSKFANYLIIPYHKNSQPKAMYKIDFL
jgi:hypothetical protein